MNVGLSNAAQTRRPLAARMRPDLCCSPQVHGGEVVWVVKDPVALQYVTFGCEEFALLQLLDGRRTPLGICREFDQRFVPRRLSLLNLGAFVARVHGLGLVLSDAPGQGARLYERRQQKRRWSGAQSLLSVLAIRFRGFDADRLLDGLERRTRWAFRPWCLALCLCLMIAALLLVLSHPMGAGALWQDQGGLFSGDNLWRLMAAIAIAKILHELGHGIACKHFGGECHEIGVMLLAFIPCLYCNVSDAWMIPDKWRRIAVSGAGMFVELLLASVSACIWCWTEPGEWNRLALNMLLLCSLNTVLLNGNPLLRYDGYYILSDLWGIPNLAQQSRAVVHDAALRLIGVDGGAIDIRPDRRSLLMAYGVLSGVYRLLVLAGILWMLHRALTPLGLASAAWALSVLTVGGVLAGPALGTARWLRRPPSGRPVNRRRLLPALVIAGIIAAGVLLLPAPQHVRAPFVIEPAEAQPIYASTAGRLVTAVGCGDTVRAGDVVARLENPDLELQIAELTGRCARQAARIAALETRRDRDEQAVQELPEARQALAALQQQLEVVQENHRRLTVATDASGVVIPPPAVEPFPESAEPPPISPIEKEQYGRLIPAGTLLCVIGRPEQLQATLLVDEGVVDQVQVGQTVTLQADAVPLQRLSGVVTEISRQDVSSPQQNVASWSRLMRGADSGAAAGRRGTYYEARVELSDQDSRLRIGGRGAALITVQSESLGSRLYRALRQVFGLRV